MYVYMCVCLYMQSYPHKNKDLIIELFNIKMEERWRSFRYVKAVKHLLNF